MFGMSTFTCPVFRKDGPCCNEKKNEVVYIILFFLIPLNEKANVMDLAISVSVAFTFMPKTENSQK